MILSYSQSRSRLLRPAFTLVEMIVVISIITVLLSVGAMSLQNMTESKGVSSGIPIAEGLFAEARTLAMSKGTNARVYIHAETTSREQQDLARRLRYMSVFYENTDDEGNVITGEWIASSRGESLPQGVFFDQQLSELNGPIIPQDTATLPGNRTPKTCYYYEFNAEGIISDPGLSQGSEQTARFVLRSGSLPPGASAPIAGKNKRDVGGFVIWPSGRTSLFRSPNQIDSSL
ncbi:pilus assembly FimT family protein [Persicirhabdus sediminis]|uniref:Prepilin-type N-terminal cleavage/methylation domain-containing protein n=1 Tax=Persicirhabdus sediminis TaxID=454144 RepID=A0A8J7MFB3_9BACT|nr:prepilin-type N-terminal cleavage/methylation domain-containing protein [Persicirhabdus sediminis]MBK1792381.1 prepilin-type N-terminal cleavage/methylation domain-containing protein [Persicirhabdus sediminis]